MPIATPRRRATAVVATVTALALVTGACGDGDGATTETIQQAPLTPAEMKVIDGAREAVDGYCVEVAAALSGERAVTEPARERATAAIDRLAALAARNPDATAPDGTDASLALSDIAEFLEGSNCDSRLIERIEEQLGAIEDG